MPVFQSLGEALQAMAGGETRVDLAGAEIGDAGARQVAEALKSNTGLQEQHRPPRATPALYLGSNSIGDEGARELAEALKSNTGLQWLFLFANSIGDEGARELAEALKSNTGLQRLRLGGNSIGDQGARELAEALTFNASLKELDLVNNSISDPGASALLEALRYNSTLTEIDLDENMGIGQDLMQEIKALIQRNKERCIILQVTTMPSKNEIHEDDSLNVAVTKMSGEQVFNQPLQPETKLREVAGKVAKLCGIPVAKLRWVLPGPRSVGTESLDEPLMQLLQGGPLPVEANLTDEAGVN